MTITVTNDDIRNWVKNYRGKKFHAILSDPPYHLTSITKRFGKPDSKPAKYGKDGAFKRASRGFMQTTWDGGDIAFDSDMWHSLGELLLPGAFMFIYAGTRTYHRVAVAVEDAGFVIHPAVGWVTSQGFPKATRIDTQIDRKEGANRETIGEPKTGVASGTHKHAGTDSAWGYDDNYLETAPATPLAKTWAGHRYGLLALKPAFEFILCAQKPYDGKPLSDILSNGAGALNIDAARIGSEDTRGIGGKTAFGVMNDDNWEAKPVVGGSIKGRWPSNVVMSHLPECKKVGERVEYYPINRFIDGAKPFGDGAGHLYETVMEGAVIDIYNCAPGCPVLQVNDQSRAWNYKDMSQVFYTTPPVDMMDAVKYVPKVAPEERHAGLNGNGNTHPTLKPIDLNKWLASLLLPPPEYAPRRILVPFAGVLSEAIGAELAGWEEVEAIELTPEYIPIGKARADYWINKDKNSSQMSFL